MTQVYAGPMVLYAPDGYAPAHLAMARKLLGQMMESGQRWQLPNQQRVVTLPDGAVVRVRLGGGLPQVQIAPATPVVPPEETVIATQWVPRGFVVYPAWHSAAFGVGLPVVPQGGAPAPYARVNLSPGLDPSRWTPGGPCGEVLVSPDVDAGYPPEPLIPAPLLADAAAGPQLVTSQPTNLDSVAPNGAWQGYRWEMAPFVAHYADENTAVQQATFEAVNAARVAAGQTPATMRLRGFARTAEIAASIFVTAGTEAESSTAYPTAYQTSAARVTKEGYPCDWAQTTQASFTRADVWSVQEYRAMGPSPVPTWQAEGGLLLGNLGPAAPADVGYRGGCNVLHLASRDRWLQAGNASWQSADTTLPPISWHSFASMNLAWETYPAIYDVVNRATAPLVPLGGFTTATGDCWLNYPRSTSPTVATSEPALGRHIYSRGRAIALAPNGGLVWAAGVIANGASDRLVALIHHPADQPSDATHNGYTRYLRVWWADIPRRDSGQRLAPPLTVCGTDANDPLAWRGGTLVDVGHMPAPSTGGSVADGVCSSLKYASCWRFSPDGLKAACLRDYGLYTDYSDLFAVMGVQTSYGKFPRAVELTFSTGTVSLSVSTIFHDYTPGALAAPKPRTGLLDTGAMGAFQHNEQPAVPLAVDYDGAGALVYAYQAQITGASANYTVTYLGLGGAMAAYASDLTHRVLTGADHQLGQGGVVNFYPSGWNVVDVSTASFIVDGVLPNIAVTINPDGSFTTSAVVAPCFPFTNTLVHGVTLYEGGSALRTDWYPAPDGAVFTLATACDSGAALMVELPLAISRCVQGYRAARFGERVLCYQVAPMPQAVVVLNSSPSGACGCREDLQKIAGTDVHLMAFNEINPRGGASVSSVALPSNDWLIYAKVA